ncbi:MAG: hypothetical protein JXX29_13335 [Deltaproteobacteria bacterium]|nr:hypothetical protein [Deltaproteobacteria bacterium]MBN2672662.1 hypothetical protein [Deltaproteobacteria bacterium]
MRQFGQRKIWVLAVCCIACQPISSEQKTPDTVLRGTRIDLETRLAGKHLRVRGDEMVASQTLSTVSLKENVSIELGSMGVVSCDTVEITNEAKTLRCDGNVSARLQIPDVLKRPLGESR